MRINAQMPRAWDTASAGLSACARALGDSRDVGQIAVESGLAFRVTLDDRASLGSPHCYPFREELSAAAERLGYRALVVASAESTRSALFADAVVRAAKLAEDGLVAGRPTLIWGVHAPEFGIVVGAEGAQLLVSGILDGVAAPIINASELGQGDVPLLFALQLTERREFSREEILRATLHAALQQGRGAVPTLNGFSTGIAAWNRAIAALESGAVDPAGLAYAAQRYAESRVHIARWLEQNDLDAIRAPFARSMNMLSELAQCHPFPPSEKTILTSNDREQAQALLVEVVRAENSALDAVAAHLRALDRAGADSVRVVDASHAELKDLFACTAELPVQGLTKDADACREKLAPQLGEKFFAKLIYEREHVVAQLLYANLSDAHYPLTAEGKRWFVFCPWVSRSARGRGLGKILFDSLRKSARADGIDGLLTFATEDEKFLHSSAFERFGFREVARAGEIRLLELTLSDLPSLAKFSHPLLGPRMGPPTTQKKSALPVLVRQAYNCPLLLHTRTALVDAAKKAGDRVALSVHDAGAEPAHASVGERALPHRFIPDGAVRDGLTHEIENW